MEIDKVNFNYDGNNIFSREGSVLKGFLYFYKKTFLIVMLTGTLILLLLILAALIIGLFVFLVRAIIFAVIAIVFLVLLELFIYFAVRRASRIYKLRKISVDSDSLNVFSSDLASSQRIFFRDILKIKYSGGYAYLMSGGSIFLYHLHYIIIYRDINREERKLLVPLDLPELKKFLGIVIEKAELKKIQSNRFSLFFEWGKLSQGNQGALKDQSVKTIPSAVDPNANIGRLVLVVLVVAIIIGYFILHFLWR